MQTLELRQAIDLATQIKDKMMAFESTKMNNFPNENYADLFHRLFEKRQTPQAATTSYQHHRSNSIAKNFHRLTTDQSDGPLSQPTMPNFQIQNDLAEVNEHQEEKNSEILDSKIDRLEGVLARFEDMFEDKITIKEKSYQYERKIMSEKIVELVSDLKTSQENVRDYQSTIEILCKNHMNLKKQYKRLMFDNRNLIMKLSTLKETQNQLSYYKSKNDSLVKLIHDLKKETKELFEKEIQEQEEYKIFIEKTISENKNLRKMLNDILDHQNFIKIDSIAKEPIVQELSEDFNKLIEDQTKTYQMKIKEYIEDLKNKRGALDNMEQIAGLENIINEENFIRGDEDEVNAFLGQYSLIQNLGMMSESEGDRVGLRDESMESPY